MPTDQLVVQLAGYRVALGISQVAMAGRLHVDPKSISRWENGHAGMSLAVARAYAREVGSRLAVVVDEDGCE